MVHSVCETSTGGILVLPLCPTTLAPSESPMICFVSRAHLHLFILLHLQNHSQVKAVVYLVSILAPSGSEFCGLRTCVALQLHSRSRQWFNLIWIGLGWAIPGAPWDAPGHLPVSSCPEWEWQVTDSWASGEEQVCGSMTCGCWAGESLWIPPRCFSVQTIPESAQPCSDCPSLGAASKSFRLASS